MLCYRDRSYCSSGVPGGRCVNMGCERRLTEGDRARAAEMGLPVGWMDFWGHCLIRKPSPSYTGQETLTLTEDQP